MCSPSIPEPPDPKETAAAQTGTNVSTAIANSILGNVNQVTPYGSLNYTYDQKFVNDDNGQTWWLGPDGQYQKEAPAGVGAVTNSNTAQSGGFGGGERLNQRGETSAAADANGRQRQGQGQTQVPDGWSQVNGYYIPSWTATQTLSPEQQKLYETGLQAKQNLSDLAVSQSSRLQDLLGTPFDLSGAPTAGDPSKLSMPNLPTYEKYASAPSLATSFGDAGDINSNYMTSFGDAGKINKEFVKSFDDAGPITRTYNTDFSEDRDKVEQALMERLQPYIDRDNEAMRSQLLNSGVRQGSTAYSGAQGDFDRKVNDARIANILAAGQEQSRLVGLERDRATFENAAQNQDFQQKYTRAAFENQGLQFENDAQAQEFGQLLSRAQFTNQGIQLGNAAQQQRFQQLLDRATFGNNALQQNFLNQFNVTQGNNQLAQQGFQNETQLLNAQMAKLNAENQARQQYLSEQYALRNQPINEISALLSGSQVQSPQFVNTNMPTIPTTDTAGIINNNYQQQVAKAQAESAFGQNILGGLFGLGSSMIMASDKRVKKDIKKVGEVKGQKLYEYHYKGEGDDDPKHIGFMAQEIERTMPDAVLEISGVKHLNVPKVIGGLMAMGAS